MEARWLWASVVAMFVGFSILEWTEVFPGQPWLLWVGLALAVPGSMGMAIALVQEFRSSPSREDLERMEELQDRYREFLRLRNEREQEEFRRRQPEEE